MFRCLATLFLLTTLSLPATAVPPESGTQSGAEPAATVEAFHKVLLAALKQPAKQDRESTITPAVRQYFNLTTISRISLGRYWRSLETSDQAELEARLGELVSTTYAARFDRWNDQVFETLESVPLPKNRVRVKTRLFTPDETVNLDYQLQLKDNRWQIYDIVANGVSDLALKRAHFGSLFADGGLASVLQDINNSIEDNRR